MNWTDLTATNLKNSVIQLEQVNNSQSLTQNDRETWNNIYDVYVAHQQVSCFSSLYIKCIIDAHFIFV